VRIAVVGKGIVRGVDMEDDSVQPSVMIKSRLKNSTHWESHMRVRIKQENILLEAPILPSSRHTLFRQLHNVLGNSFQPDANEPHDRR